MLYCRRVQAAERWADFADQPGRGVLTRLDHQHGGETTGRGATAQVIYPALPYQTLVIQSQQSPRVT
jgi:hypothetical protein